MHTEQLTIDAGGEKFEYTINVYPTCADCGSYVDDTAECGNCGGESIYNVKQYELNLDEIGMYIEQQKDIEGYSDQFRYIARKLEMMAACGWEYVDFDGDIIYIEKTDSADTYDS